MATESWVIRLSRVDQDNQPILVHVSRKPGGQALDLDLLATDGEFAWRGKIRDRKLDKLRVVGYDGTPEQWSSILQYILLPPDSPPSSVDFPDSLRDTLDVACTIAENAKKSLLSITIRQSVQDITHKFGSLQLAYSDDTDEVDLFGWASEAAKKRDSLAAELRTGNARIEEAEEVIKSLQAQLQDFIAAKAAHETQLLSKFAVLLNEKKLRVRVLQRQLAHQHASPLSKSTGNPESARKRKKMDDNVPDNASESEGFDAMDVDRDNDATEDESEAARRASSDSDSASESDAPSPPAKLAKTPSEYTAALPPPRELPFGITSKSQDADPPKAAARVSPAENEETASEDDEL